MKRVMNSLVLKCYVDFEYFSAVSFFINSQKKNLLIFFLVDFFPVLMKRHTLATSRCFFVDTGGVVLYIHLFFVIIDLVLMKKNRYTLVSVRRKKRLSSLMCVDVLMCVELNELTYPPVSQATCGQ